MKQRSRRDVGQEHTQQTIRETGKRTMKRVHKILVDFQNYLGIGQTQVGRELDFSFDKIDILKEQIA